MGYILKEDTVLNARELQELIAKRKFCYTDKVNIANGIYGIRNLVNNKVYIGSAAQKSGGIKRRWHEHITNLNKNNHCNYHLQNSWNYYGLDNFEFFVVEIMFYDGTKESENKIRQREEYYFDKYKSLNREYGYNIAKNAEGGGTCLTIQGIKDGRFKVSWEQMERILNELQNTDKPIKQIAREENLESNFVRGIYNHSILSKEFENLNFIPRLSATEKMNLQVEELNNHLEKFKEDIQQYPNLNYLSKKYNISEIAIKRFMAKNNLEFPEITGDNKVWGRPIKVYQYALSGEYIGEFSSASQAENEFNITHGKVINCCNGNRNSAGGYRWSYYKDDRKPELTLIEQIFEEPLSKRFRPIVQYDLNWNIVGYYMSYRKAMDNGFSSLEWYLKDVNRLINKPYKGFIFKYIDELPEEKVLEILNFKENKEDFYNEQEK